MRTVINVEDITPEVTGATSKDYLAGYLRAKEKLAMQIKAFSACGLAEAEQRAKAQMRFVDGKICEYRAKIKEEEREMYRMVLKVMMACDYANGLSLDFAEYFERKTHTAEDYDIQNAFGETDHVVDLFAEIDKGYGNKPSVFDRITTNDLIIAFFPCVYFEAIQMIYYSVDNCNNLRSKSGRERYDIILERIANRSKFYLMLRKLIFTCMLRKFRLIVENPCTQPHYLLFTQNFYKPSVIDNDRTMRGDFFKKPTAYWFFNCEPTNLQTFTPP